MSTMHVPQHISVTGEANNATVLSLMDDDDVSKSARKTMTVPDRIIVAGGNRHIGERSPPDELLVDRKRYPDACTANNAHSLPTPPSTLTLDSAPFPDVDDRLAAKRAAAEAENNNSSNPTTPRRTAFVNNDSVGASVSFDDPQRELRRLNGRMKRLATRVYELEADMAARRQREYALIGVGGVLALLYFIKKMITV